MFKTKKVLCLVLAVAMLVSSMAFTAFADDSANAEITYWNADSTKITLDISKDVDAQYLANSMSLIKDGVKVPFTVKKKIPTTTATLDSNQVRSLDYATAGYREALPADTDYTYEIHPVGGIELDEMYVIAINESVLGTAWKKGITAKKLWKETFDNYESIEVTPWTPSHSKKLTLEGTEDKYLQYIPGSNGAGPRVGISPAYKQTGNSWVETQDDTNATAKAKRDAIFADTGVASRTYWANAVKEREYNLELEMKVQPTTAGSKEHGIQIYMGTRCNYGGRWAGSFVMAGTGLRGDLPADKDNAILDTKEGVKYRMYAGTVNMFANTRSTTVWGYQVNGPVSGIPSTVPGADANLYNYMSGAAYSDKASDSVIATSNLTDDDLTNDVVNKVAMSVKDKNIKFTIDSPQKSGFTSYNFTQGLADSNVQLGLPLIVLESSGYNDSYYHIDNIIATKAVLTDLNDLTVDYWNADTTKMTLDLNAAFSAADLQEAITVYKDSVPTGFTVTKLTAKGDATNTYAVKPEGGFAEDSVYTVAIAPGSYVSTDGKIYALAEEYAKSFEVKRYFTDEFDYTDADNPWHVANTEATLSIYTEGNGNNMMKIDALKYAQIAPRNSSKLFADTGKKVSEVFAADSEVRALEEYTTEVQVMAVPNTSGGFSFAVYQNNSTYSTKTFRNALYFYKTGIKYDYYGKDASDEFVKEGPSSTITYPEMVLSTTEMSNIALSYKDGTVKYSLGDAVYTKSGITLTMGGMGYPFFATESGSTSYYVDKLIYSKAVEVDGLQFDKQMTVTANGEAVEALGTDLVDISINVQNYGATVPCKVIMAVYGTDSVTNVKVSDITTFAGGMNTFAFEDINPNGGNRIRIFFWDGLDTLVPYTNSVNWTPVQ